MERLSNIKEYAEKYAVPIIRPQTAKLIENFVQEKRPENVLEIGTAIGYSGLIFLLNSNAKLTTIEHNEKYIKVARQNFKKFHKMKNVKIINNDCLVVLAKMASQKKYNNFFDIVFLDGPKAQYDKLLELALIILKSGGTIIVDDVLFHGIENTSKRFKTIISRMENFTEKCKNHQNISKFTLKNIEDGIIFAEKG